MEERTIERDKEMERERQTDRQAQTALADLMVETVQTHNTMQKRKNDHDSKCPKLVKREKLICMPHYS